MKNISRAQRAKLTAAVLYPEDGEALLTLGRVAEMTNRDIRVIRYFVVGTPEHPPVLPAQKQPNGHYLVQAKHVAIVLWQPAWNETQRLTRRLTRTTVPGTTPRKEDES